MSHELELSPCERPPAVSPVVVRGNAGPIAKAACLCIMMAKPKRFNKPEEGPMLGNIIHINPTRS